VAMKPFPSWQSLLGGLEIRDHVALLYADEAFLTRALTHFVVRGLAAGEATTRGSISASLDPEKGTP